MSSTLQLSSAGSIIFVSNIPFVFAVGLGVGGWTAIKNEWEKVKERMMKKKKTKKKKGEGEKVEVGLERAVDDERLGVNNPPPPAR